MRRSPESPMSAFWAGSCCDYLDDSVPIGWNTAFWIRHATCRQHVRLGPVHHDRAGLNGPLFRVSPELPRFRSHRYRVPFFEFQALHIFGRQQN